MNQEVDTIDQAAETRARPKMSPDIAKAILTVMAKIKPLTKDSKNTFQKYSYVSVDQFYDLVGRLMAEADLFVMAFEKTMIVAKQSSTDDRGVTKESVWLSAVYDMYLYHASGAEFGPIERSIKVPASGAQSYASALSFVEKYFLRGLFKIPTGDPDADAEDKRTLPDTAVINDLQYEELLTEITSQGGKTLAGMLAFFNIESLSDLPASRYGEAVARLKERRARAETAKKITIESGRQPEAQDAK
jgi:hypothetical protein